MLALTSERAFTVSMSTSARPSRRFTVSPGSVDLSSGTATSRYSPVLAISGAFIIFRKTLIVPSKAATGPSKVMPRTGLAGLLSMSILTFAPRDSRTFFSVVGGASPGLNNFCPEPSMAPSRTEDMKNSIERSFRTASSVGNVGTLFWVTGLQRIHKL